MHQFGGLRGGRPRLDGLPPGSEAAKKADRDKHAKEMRDIRAAERKASRPLPAMVVPVKDAGTAPPDRLQPDLVAQVAAPVVAWQADALKPLTDELIAAWEDSHVQKMRTLAGEARFPIDVVNKIGKDSNFPPVGKKSLQIGLPRVSAKWLNKAGVSAEWEPEVVTLQGFILIQMHNSRQYAELQKLIEEQKQKADAKK